MKYNRFGLGDGEDAGLVTELGEIPARRAEPIVDVAAEQRSIGGSPAVLRHVADLDPETAGELLADHLCHADRR